jgi:hypothetical protein
MKAETKFNVNDEVFILHEMKIIKVTVYGIDVAIKEETTDINYRFKVTKFDDWNFVSKEEKEVFSSSDELLNYLQS